MEERLQRLLKVDEFANVLRVHELTVRRWIANGKLTALRVGVKGVRIPESELRKVIVERERPKE